MKRFAPLLCAVLCGAAGSAFGSGNIPESELDPFYQVGPASIECVVEAARRQRVPANVLLALATVEGGKNGAMIDNRPRSGHNSDDIGHFQINTQHFRPSGVLGRAGIRVVDVAWRGCYNAEIAAWMLRKELEASTGQDYWTRVANYHSKTPRYNAAYRRKVIPAAIRWGDWLRNRYGNVAVAYQPTGAHP